MLRGRALLYASIGLGIAAASTTAAAKCTMAQLAEWPVKLEGSHLLVEGSINGQKIGVMLDTGSSTLILRSAADRLGLTRHEARGYRAFGIGGETHVEVANIAEFTVGQLSRKNWRVMVAGERDFGKSIDFILGEDFFDQLDLEIDLPHHAVRLFQAEDCEGVALAYWASQGAGQVELQPYYNAGQRIIVPVKVNGQPMQAMVDSGAFSSVLDKPVAERLGIKQDSPGARLLGTGGGLGGKTVESWIGPLQSFTIGDETISDTVVRFADLWKDATYVPPGSRLLKRLEDTPALLLGADFLRAHRVLVAHSQRKMYFTYEGGPVFQPKAAAEARRSAPATQSAKPAEPTAKSDPAN
jgi:predicted aspartyl protease